MRGDSMTNMELVLYPQKRISAKVELLTSDRNDFSFLKKYIFWGQYSDSTWQTVTGNPANTWKEISLRSEGGSVPEIAKTMEGDVVNMGLTIDRESDVRRVISLSMHLNDPQYFISNFKEVWLNRLIRISIGLWDWSLEENKWFTLGSFLVTKSDYTYDAESQLLQLSIADLMASITEERGSMIGSEVKIEAEENMHNALEAFVAQFFPFTFTNITSFNGETVPYDLEFERGIFPYEVAKKIVDLYPTYEHFYTPDGVYTVQEIPTSIDTPAVLTADDMDALVISDSGSLEPKQIKNITEVWGNEIDEDYADYTAQSCTTVNNVYELFIDEDWEVYEEGQTYAFTTSSDSISGQQIKIQDGQPVTIIVEDSLGYQRPVNAGELLNDVQYVVKYTNFTFELIGPSIIHAMAALFNETPEDSELLAMKHKYNCNDIRVMVDRDNQFSVEHIGEQVQVFAGGDYDSIYTTQLAVERAYYENWKSARALDTIKLKMIYVPWLDVNQKVEYRNLATREANTYITQNISVDLETFTMDVTMTKFYPYYPYLRRAKKWNMFEEDTWEDLEDLYWSELMYEDE